ncbi:MAG: WbqC family protein, partial [Actinomycetota bacterium]
ITTPIRRASELDGAPDGRGDDDAEGRLISLCERTGADTYYNLSGGVDLYDDARFSARGVTLRFRIPPEPAPEGTAARDDQTLSVLDLLMRHGPDEVASRVRQSQWTRPGPEAAELHRRGEGR